MIAKLTDDLQYITLFFETEAEQLQTSVYFRKKIDNFHFLQKKLKAKGKRLDGIVNYMIGADKLKSTQWSNLMAMCERFGFPLQFQNFENLIRDNITYEQVKDFCYSITEHLDDIVPYDYQVESVYNAYKYRFTRLDVGTGGGKTLTMYLLMMLLRYTKQASNILIIEPDPSYVVQTFQEFSEYSGGRYNLKMGMAYGESKDKKNIGKFDHVIGNFQTLSNFDETFLSKFDTIFCDESHRSTSSSIMNIIKKCGSLKNRVGLSGSHPKVGDNSEHFTNEDNFGIVSYVISKKNLVELGATTDCKIIQIIVDFANEKEKLQLAIDKDYIDDPEKKLRYEQQFVRSNKRLFEWKCQLVSKMKGNTLVYFTDKKGGFGKQIYERLVELNIYHNLGKKVYFIDGDVSVPLRETIKSEIKNHTEGNCILVANYATFSTGQSIKNLVNILYAEAFKSSTTNNQTMGRLARLYEGKEMTYLYDIVETTNTKKQNLTTGKVDPIISYMHKWGRERASYYLEEGFEIETVRVNIAKDY